MKKLSILLAWAAFLAGGCSDETPFGRISPDGEPRVEVGFRLEAVDTDASIEPMTRVTSYKEWFANACRLLILKKADTRWIVDATQTVLLDATSSSWTELKLSALPPCTFGLELRPGDYRIVAVLNYQSGDWNPELVPGRVVADEADASLRTPPMITYRFSTHWMNNGFRQLNREVFVAVADFTVPKSGDLHSEGVPAVTLRAERRVAKFRVLLKDMRSTGNKLSFRDTEHTVRMRFTSKTTPFAEGIDALGGMYYGDAGLYDLPWCASTTGMFHASGANTYQMSQTNSTVFSPFLFAGPEEEIPFEISDIRISGQSGSDGVSYKTDAVFTRTLACSSICGIVFEATLIHDDSALQPLVDIVESTDGKGDPEDAAALFDPFYEWNAASY